jgi:hypothetical protein
MANYHVITWRAPGGCLWFFRGDNRYEIFLPYISEGVVSRGWVADEAQARVFEGFLSIDTFSLARNFDARRLNVYPYEGPLLKTQLFKEPRWKKARTR